jgi:glucose/arabinose dehydrogenase
MTSLVLSALLSLQAPAVPFSVGGDPRVDPADFRITEFASGLATPYGMQRLDDGSLIVGSTVGGFGSVNGGQIVRLHDTNHNGIADGPPQVIASGLPGMVTGVRRAGDLVAAVSVNFIGNRVSYITLLREGATPTDPLTQVAQVRIDYTFDNPEGFYQHIASTLETRPTPGEPGKHDLFFQLGSERNGDVGGPTPTDATHHIDFSGDLTASNVPAEKIYKITVDDSAGIGTPTLSPPVAVAAGVRNPAGLAIHPATGDLYFQDNGIDNNAIEGGHESLSVDELNLLTVAQLNGGVVPNYGFPFSYVEYRTGNLIGPQDGVTQPIATFQPIPNPLTGAESEGAAEIAFAPELFPDGLNNGIFIAFAGREPSPDGSVDPERPVVFFDLTTGEYFHFIASPFFGEHGALDSLFTTEDSLFLTDPFGSGAIYQITAIRQEPGEPGAIPEFTTASLGAIAMSSLAIFLGRRRGLSR